MHPLGIPVGNVARLNDKLLMPSIPSGCTIVEYMIILKYPKRHAPAMPAPSSC